VKANTEANSRKKESTDIKEKKKNAGGGEFGLINGLAIPRRGKTRRERTFRISRISWFTK